MALVTPLRNALPEEVPMLDRVPVDMESVVHVRVISALITSLTFTFLTDFKAYSKFCKYLFI